MRVFITLLAFELGLSAVSFATANNPLPVWKSKVVAGVQTLQKANLFVGGVVAVIAADDADYWSLGVQSPASPKAPEFDQIFEIGSISKSFTGIILAQLVNEGRAKLDDRVETFLPELKGTFAGQATLEQLATHTSGLPSGICGDRTKPECFTAPDPLNPYAQEDWPVILRFLLKFARPDSGPYPNAYSNLGFELLGKLLTRLDGSVAFEQMLKRRITTPLGMNSTFIRLPSLQNLRFIDGFNVLQQRAPHWDFSDASAPAGGIRSSARDMMAYLRANLTPDASALGRAIKLSQLKSLGWDSDPGAQTVWKNGETGGFANIILVNATARVGYMQLTNQAASISQNLQRLISGQQLPTIPNYPVVPKVLASEVGTYRLRGATGGTATFEVRPFGSSLAIYNGGTGIRLFPNSDIDFVLYDGVFPLGGTGRLAFTRVGNETTGFVLRILGKDLTCDRVAN